MPSAEVAQSKSTNRAKTPARLDDSAVQLVNPGTAVSGLQLECWKYPLAATIRDELVALFRTAWTRTDFNWLEAMHGDYGDQLTIISSIAREQGRAIASATVLFSQHEPELALMGNVVTHPDFRSRGIGGSVIESATTVAQRAGCLACYLGTEAREHNVYRQCGFNWHHGKVMRRLLSTSDDFESDYFRARQPVTVRTAGWGDLPGVTLLAIQPIETCVLDYSRGIVSPRYAHIERCVSVFPIIQEDLRTHGGTMKVLAEPRRQRIFGFGTVTLGAGPARRHTAIVDFAVHDHYLDEAGSLLQSLLDYCGEQSIRTIYAAVAESDQQKKAKLLDAGFTSTGSLHGAAVLCGEPCDVTILSRRYPNS
jgi:GNAT superfamily N-acetyltransferase/L-amino acid N-acyltransferase YncA